MARRSGLSAIVLLRPFRAYTGLNVAAGECDLRLAEMQRELRSAPQYILGGERELFVDQIVDLGLREPRAKVRAEIARALRTPQNMLRARAIGARKALRDRRRAAAQTRSSGRDGAASNRE